MKSKKFTYGVIWFSLIVLISFTGCEEFEEPAMINEPTLNYIEDPVITSVIPPDSAVAGVRRIVIQGNNFAVSGQDTTWVYIGGEPTAIKSINPNEIVVDRPAKYGDDINISVVVPRALKTAKILGYKIEQPLLEFGDFSRENYDLTAIAVATNEDLYIATRRAVLHLTSDGINLTTIASLSSAFATITDMKFGPGGYLYMLIGRRDMYRLDPVVGEDEEYASLSRNSSYFDFDQNDNVYFGSRDGLWVLTTDKTEIFTELHDESPIRAIRVYNGYVYVASAKQLKRNQILDNSGSIGQTEVLVDLNNISSLSSSDISSFTFDANGMTIICLTNISGNPLFVLEEDGSMTPYYTANILPSSIDQIVYGRGRYMYLNRGMSLDRDSVRLYKMGMQYEGAPYYGRE